MPPIKRRWHTRTSDWPVSMVVGVSRQAKNVVGLGCVRDVRLLNVLEGTVLGWGRGDINLLAAGFGSVTSPTAMCLGGMATCLTSDPCKKGSDSVSGVL